MRIRRSLVDLDDLSAADLASIFKRTAEFEAEAPGKLLDGVVSANMFLRTEHAHVYLVQYRRTSIGRPSR